MIYQDLGDEFFGPIRPVEVAAWDCKVESLYFIEMCGDVAFGDVPPSNAILALRKGF